MPAELISDGEVRCTSPAAISAAEVMLFVSLNAVDYLGGANTTFIFSPSAAPLAAPHPPLGPTYGDTLLLLRLAPRRHQCLRHRVDLRGRPPGHRPGGLAQLPRELAGSLP